MVLGFAFNFHVYVCFVVCTHMSVSMYAPMNIHSEVRARWDILVLLSVLLT